MSINYVARIIAPWLPVAILCVLIGCQQDATPPKIVIEDVWSMPVMVSENENHKTGAGQDMPKPNGVVYLTIKNEGATADRLLRASSAVCDTVELHTTIIQDEKMMMKPLDGMEIPAGKQVAFKPRSDHIMLIGLNRSLRSESQFELELQFEKSGAMAVTSTVRRP